MAEDAAAMALKTKSFAEAVIADAKTKTKMADDAKTAADKAIEDLATSAFAAGQSGLVPLQMGTLSKAIGGYGGYLCASRAVIDLMKTRARTLIYSTALPPASMAAAIAGLRSTGSSSNLGPRRFEVVVHPFGKRGQFLEKQGKSSNPPDLRKECNLHLSRVGTAFAGAATGRSTPVRF